ncbi:hypothetical protein OWV82_017732 [Melia azedarach]|uniref:Uncharacterized protein n=1 Tax=Melia azedarach TaxID=155640 RepID=A0ACC1XA88_MELAZ|nr:hypothetical protein OWV82_017732 [Melia azedarach]
MNAAPNMNSFQPKFAMICFPYLADFFGSLFAKPMAKRCLTARKLICFCSSDLLRFVLEAGLVGHSTFTFTRLFQ